MSNDRTERALLYKCIVCSKIFACWFDGRYCCNGCLRDLKDCPKSFPSARKDFSSGLCPICREKRKETCWQWWGCKKVSER